MVGTALVLRDLKPETAIAIRAPGSADYMVSAKDIVEYCAPGAPINEAKKFLLICQTTGLNPLLGDIDLMQIGGKWCAGVRKNGYLKCARRDPDYDGHESGVVVQPYSVNPLTKGKTWSGPAIDIRGAIVPPGHLLVGGWAKVYSKSRSRPVYKRCSLEEYDKKTVTWNTIKCTMIEKVPISHACREAFDLMGALYDEAELDEKPQPIRATVVNPPSIEPTSTDQPKGLESERFPGTYVHTEESNAGTPITQEQIGQIIDMAESLKMTYAQIANIYESRGASRLNDLDTYQGATIISRLTTILSRPDYDPIGDKGKEAPQQVPAAPAVQEPEVIDAEVSEVALLRPVPLGPACFGGGLS